MAALQRSAIQAGVSRAPCALLRPVTSVRSRVVVSAAKDAGSVSRREALVLSGAVLLSLSGAAPAKAFLGFGDNTEQVKEAYTKESAAILSEVKTVLALDRNDPTKEDQIKVMRKNINSWVAKYRREQLVAGRPSYGNMYSALNAVAGHYNNFGTTAPIPKKRLDRLVKELDDASLFLSKGR